MDQNEFEELELNVQNAIEALENARSLVGDLEDAECAIQTEMDDLQDRKDHIGQLLYDLEAALSNV